MAETAMQGNLSGRYKPAYRSRLAAYVKNPGENTKVAILSLLAAWLAASWPGRISMASCNSSIVLHYRQLADDPFRL